MKMKPAVTSFCSNVIFFNDSRCFCLIPSSIPPSTRTGSLSWRKIPCYSLVDRIRQKEKPPEGGFPWAVSVSQISVLWRTGCFCSCSVSAGRPRFSGHSGTSPTNDRSGPVPSTSRSGVSPALPYRSSDKRNLCCRHVPEPRSLLPAPIGRSSYHRQIY
jgi:hypothetical protein